MESFTVRKANMEDLLPALELYDRARQFMREHGNPGQWADGYPSPSLVQSGIVQGSTYVCEAGGRAACIFYFSMEEDPEYGDIYDGAWLNEEPYAVVHRVASAGAVKGGAGFCLSWAFEQWPNIRIDTHRDNIPMQKLLEKNGFQRCGKICLSQGGERIAYQKTGLKGQTHD